MKLTQKVLRLAEGALLHAGPPCSSYVWVNRGTSARTTECPLGNLEEPSVKKSNTIPGYNVGLFWACGVVKYDVLCNNFII